VTPPEDPNRCGDDSAREAGEFNQLAKHGTQQEHREVELDEADHFFHKQPGKRRADSARIGQQHGAERRNRGKQNHAVSAIGRQHQQCQRRQGN